MTDFLEEELKDPKAVKRLRLHNGEFSDLPEEIGLFINLEYLELSFNNLESLPGVVCKLENLQKLHIRNNKLIELNENMDSLKRLKMIHMPGNPAIDSVKVFQQLSRLPKLEKLSLGDCGVRAIDPSISKFSNLRVLHLYGNLISELPEEIYGLRKLQVLDLLRNPIEIGKNVERFQAKGLRIEI